MPNLTPSPTPAQDASLVSAIPELAGEVTPEHFAEGPLFDLLAWGVVVLLIIAITGFIWWLRRRHRVLTPPPTALQLAMQQLQQLETQLPPLRECSLQLSLIVRKFLQAGAQDPALFETHEEFSRRLGSLSAVPEECRYDTRYLLEKLADLKYAAPREQDPQQARTLIEQARTLLCRIDELQHLTPQPQQAPLP